MAWEVEFAADISLVACVAGKKLTPAPAKDLYTSPLFRKCRAYAEAIGRGRGVDLLRSDRDGVLRELGHESGLIASEEAQTNS